MRTHETTISLHRQLEQEQSYNDDSVQQDNPDTDDEAATDSSSMTSSIRATNCISFTVEPKEDQFNSLIDHNENPLAPTSFVSEESFIFFSHHSYGNGNSNYINNENYNGNNRNFGNTYMVNVREWVTAFGGVACESLNNYRDEIFENSDVDLESIPNV
jgi:hypothetical protein